MLAFKVSSMSQMSPALLYGFNCCSATGIPDEAGIRSTAWKVLLGYLPADKRKWRQVLLEQRKSYYVRSTMWDAPV